LSNCKQQILPGTGVHLSPHVGIYT